MNDLTVFIAHNIGTTDKAGRIWEKRAIRFNNLKIMLIKKIFGIYKQENILVYGVFTYENVIFISCLVTAGLCCCPFIHFTSLHYI